MIRRVGRLLVLILAPGALAAQPAAAPPEAPPAAPTAAAAVAEEPRLAVNLSGFFAFDAYSQNNFFLGKGAPGLLSDRDAYSIQLFRIQPEFAYGDDLKAVLRIDLAQSIWGIDNEQRDNFRPGFSNLFNNKDTNFLVHLDWAYLEASPEALDGWTFRIGRAKNKVGNLLVVDQNADGIQALKSFGNWSTSFHWTKLSEGVDGLTDDRFEGGLNGRDADLYVVEVGRKFGSGSVSPYLAYYDDRGSDRGSTYLPDGLQYNRPRFSPNVSRATALGVAFERRWDRFDLKGEAAWLTGRDDVPNTDSGPAQRLDVNDGDLRGWDVYLDAGLAAGPGRLRGVLGLGSGDPDPMSGHGNITKIKTNGHFYLSEVWEDSIMPDEEGITPQGLGSPASRGYREFENSTLFLLGYDWKLNERWKLWVAGMLVRATEPLHPWRAGAEGRVGPGDFGDESSKDLGSELDLKIDWQVMPRLTWTVRGGIFFPGDAAGYLVNGTNAFQENAWELRTTVRFAFARKSS